MSNVVFNVAKGRLAYYASLPLANDALIAVPIQATGIVSDATMIDYATLAALLAGGSTEQTTMGRKTLSGVTVTVNNTSDRVEVDCADVTWTAASGSAVAAFVIAYDPDTGTSTDSTRIPLVKADVTLTPDGSDFTLTIADFYRAS